MRTLTGPRSLQRPRVFRLLLGGALKRACACAILYALYFHRPDAITPSCAGEWCVAQNVYENPGALNRTQFEALSARAAARAGPPCTRVDAVTCFRTRASLRKAWDARALRPAAAASAPTPAAVGSGALQGVEPLETLPPTRRSRP